jgi:hypothetical protein
MSWQADHTRRTPSTIGFGGALGSRAPSSGTPVNCLLCRNFPPRYFKRMFRRLLFGVVTLAAAAGRLLADDLVSYERVPEAARRTIEENRGAGVVQQVEVFPFGNVKLYKVQVGINGVPEREIQVAETGKLIRVDELGTSPAPDQDDDQDNGS